MSRAFVKENDLEHAGTDLPERPQSEHPNYVTPAGLAQLQQQLAEVSITCSASFRRSKPLSTNTQVN